MPFSNPALRDDERLREALVGVERLRAREAAARAESDALLDALGRMTGAASPAAALDALLSAVAEHCRGGAAAILTGETDGSLRVAHASEPALAGLCWSGAAGLADKPRRMVDLEAQGWWHDPAAGAARGFRALVAVPVGLGHRQRAALACLSRQPAAFSIDDQRLLSRLAGLASQALAAQALAERHALLAAVIEGSAASVAIADATAPDTPLVYVNRAFEALSGYAAADVLGHNCRLLSDEPPDSPERARVRASVAARTAGRFLLRNRRRDGTRFWTQLNLYPVPGPGALARHLVATSADVTEQRAAEAERDAAEARLRAALAVTREGFLIVDAAGRVVFANAAFRSFYPAPGEGWAAGRAVDAVIADRAALGEGLGRPQHWRDRLAGSAQREDRLPDGRMVIATHVPTPEGGMVAVVTDVTRLKAAERALAARAAAVDAAQDGVALVDAAGCFVFMNPSHRAMFGFGPDDDLAALPWRALYDAEEAARLESVAFPLLMAAGAWRGEAVGRRRDGAPVEQEVSLTLLPDGGLVCVTRDIAERRRGERERLRLREQLQIAQRQEAIGQIAGGVAHDFNNLLSAIGSSAAVIARALPPDAPEQAHAARITAAASRGADLMTRLLDLGARRTARRLVDLREPVREAADLLRISLPPAVTLLTDIADSPLWADADPTDVLQVMLNLAINARDALGEMAGEIRITAQPASTPERGGPFRLGRPEAERAYHRLAVSDNGMGMDGDEAAQIFKPYFSTKGERGTGLGLAVVAGILGDYAAPLALQSALGAGAAFTVLWPAAAAETALPNLAGLTAIIAEDDPAMLALLAAALEAAGAEVAACSHPEDALEALRDDPGAWGLLVTDFDMPELTGAGLAEAARAVAPTLPVLLCTGMAGGDPRLAPHRGLFDIVLRKPVEPAAVVRAAARIATRASPDGAPPCA